MSNGPLILSDLHWLAINGSLDWPSLNAQARELGLERSLHLVLALAQKFGAHWPAETGLSSIDNGIDQAVPFVEEAAQMLLLDPEQGEERKMMRRIADDNTRSSALFSAFKQALSPHPHQLAKLANCPVDNNRRWLAYPAWLFDRGKRYFNSRKNYSASNIELGNWLRS